MSNPEVHSESLLSHLPDLVRQKLPGFLPNQRWFGDKSRSISAVELIAAFAVPGPDAAALTIVNVQFVDDSATNYLVAFGLVDEADSPVYVIANRGESPLPGIIIEGFGLPSVRTWLIQVLATGDKVSNPGGTLSADTLPVSRHLLEAAGLESSEILDIDQSNTALAYGNLAFVKVFRRLQPGVNPDVELTRFLTAKSDFMAIPAYLGSLTFTPDAENSYVLAVAQRFVESEGNGWTSVLESIRRAVSAGSTSALRADASATGSKLGTTTAAMHLALAHDPWTPAFAPERITTGDIQLWSQDYLAMLERIVGEIGRARTTLPAESVDLANTFLAIAHSLRDRAQGFTPLIGRSKTRVHGDYHLGQTLRTEDGNFIVLDFEGEPQRGLEERRRKTSPLKDVAGMLRSFSYARGVAESWLVPGTGLLASDLLMWERTIRKAFVETYLATVKTAGGTFLPESPDDTRAALTSWELDKAAYEVLYELNNRPDWLSIPLSAMIKHGEPDKQ